MDLQIENALPVGASFIDAVKHLGEMLSIFQRKWDLGDFPGGPMVRNPPCRAGEAGSVPGLGTKIPCAVEWLRLHAATESAWAAVKDPHVPQWKPHMLQLRPHTAK